MAQDVSVPTNAIGKNNPSPASEYDYKIWQIIGASAVGTMIEWYDFYIFGSLATVISPLLPKATTRSLNILPLTCGRLCRSPFGALSSGASAICGPQV